MRQMHLFRKKYCNPPELAAAGLVTGTLKELLAPSALYAQGAP